MTFAYQVQLSDPGGAGGSADPVLVDDLDKALAVWSQHVTGLGTLVVDLNIVQTPVGREDGGATTVVQSGTTASGLPIEEPSSLYELQTGRHVPGSTSDITIDVSPSYFQSLDLDAGLNADSQVPNNKYNPITTFLHEIMHGFGMEGYYDSSGNLTGNYESTFDQYIEKTSSGAAYFVGPNAEAAYGGPIRLTTDGGPESYYHFGDTDSDLYRTPTTVSDPLTLDLMNGIVFFYDYPYQISQLDLGVLKDLGYDVDNPAPISVDNGDGTHTITGTADGQVLQSIGNDVMTGNGASQTFVFSPHFGQDEVTDFAATGAGHDTIDLTATHYQNIAQILAHTSMLDGNATIHLNPVDTITLDNVTRAQLAHNARDVTFA